MESTKLNELDLLSINILVMLYEYRSATLVSQRLNVPAPKVSRSLKRARQVFDNELFMRKQHGLIPNDFSHKLYPIAKKMISCIDEIDKLDNSKLGPSQTHFNIAAPDLLAYKLPHDLMASIKAEDKPISFKISPWTSSSIEEIAEGMIDIGLLCGFTQSLEEYCSHQVPSAVLDNLSINLIQALDELYLICDTNHPLSDLEVTLEALANYPYINTVFGQAGQVNDQLSPFQQYCQHHNLKLTTEIAITSLSSLFDYLRFSQAIALVPYKAIHQLIAQIPQLTSKPLAYSQRQRLYAAHPSPNLYLITRKSLQDEQLSWLQQQVINSIKTSKQQ